MEIRGSINFCSKKFGDGELVYMMDFRKEQNWQVPAGVTFQSIILFPETYPVLIAVLGEQSGEQIELVRILVKNRNLSPVVIERLDKSFETNEIEVTVFPEDLTEGYIKGVSVGKIDGSVLLCYNTGSSIIQARVVSGLSESGVSVVGCIKRQKPCKTDCKAFDKEYGSYLLSRIVVQYHRP